MLWFVIGINLVHYKILVDNVVGLAGFGGILAALQEIIIVPPIIAYILYRLPVNKSNIAWYFMGFLGFGVVISLMSYNISPGIIVSISKTLGM